MSKKLMIIGSAIRGGALLILDSLKRSSAREYEPVGILDDTPGIIGSDILGVKVLSGLDDIQTLYEKNFFDEAIIAIGSVDGRNQVFQKIKKLDIPLANIIDDSVSLRTSVELGRGNIILSRCDFGPLVSIGDNNFFCAQTLIEHESSVGYGNLFGIGCSFAGRVKIGNLITFCTRSGANAETIVSDHAIVPAGVIL